MFVSRKDIGAMVARWRRDQIDMAASEGLPVDQAELEREARARRRSLEDGWVFWGEWR